MESRFQVSNGVNAFYKDSYLLPSWESDVNWKSCAKLTGKINCRRFLDVVVRKRSFRTHSVEDEEFFTFRNIVSYYPNSDWIFLLRGINSPTHRRTLRPPIVSLLMTFIIYIKKSDP